jgi:hypothetical protein
VLLVAAVNCASSSANWKSPSLIAAQHLASGLEQRQRWHVASLKSALAVTDADASSTTALRLALSVLHFSMLPQLFGASERQIRIRHRQMGAP